MYSASQLLSSPHRAQAPFQEHRSQQQQQLKRSGSRSPRREDIDYQRHLLDGHRRQYSNEQGSSDVEDRGYSHRHARHDGGGRLHGTHQPTDRSLDRKATFVVTKIRGANGAEEIFPVVASGYRHRLKVASETIADEALIRRVLRKANTKMDDVESEDDHYAEFIDGQQQYAEGGHHHPRSSRYGVVDTESDYDEATGSDSDGEYGAGGRQHQQADHRHSSGASRFYATSPQRQQMSRRDDNNGGDWTPKRNPRGQQHSAVQHEEEPSPARRRDRSSEQMSNINIDAAQASQPVVVEGKWRRVLTPNPLLLHPPLPVVTMATTHSVVELSTIPAQQPASADVAINTSFAIDAKIVPAHTPSLKTAGVMTSPSLQAAPPAKLDAASSPGVVPLASPRLSNAMSPMPGYHLPPSRIDGCESATPFGPEVSSVRSTSLQSVLPLPEPHTTPVISHTSPAGATRRTTLPPSGAVNTEYYRDAPLTSPLIKATPNVALASSTTSLMLSPRRRSSSPTSDALDSAAAFPAQASDTTEIYEVGTPSLRRQRAASSSQLQMPSPVFLDAPLEEYVVPLGRTAQKIVTSPAAAALRSEAAPTATTNVLRSYSHRSLFRPAREDIDAVRRLSSSLTAAKGTLSSVQTASTTSPPQQHQQPQSTAQWC
jgi:hypothetical protein